MKLPGISRGGGGGVGGLMDEKIPSLEGVGIIELFTK